MTCSIVNVAVRLEMDRDKCLDARIAVGSMAPTPLRCHKAEALIKGRNIDSEVIKECSAAAIDQTSPIDNERAAAWYQSRLVLRFSPGLSEKHLVRLEIEGGTDT